MRRRIPFLLALLPLFALACSEDGTGPDDAATSRVSVRFAGGDAPATTPPTASGRTSAQESTITVEGTNGTLEITDVRLVVSELELEGTEGACEAPEQPADDEDDAEEDDEDDTECPDFEASPFFLDLPLDGTGVDVVSDRVAEGTYQSLEFEVEDVQLDEDDEDEAELTTLAEEIRAEFPEWPDESSLRVAGTFTPTDGQASEFTTHFDAELEVEMELSPPLELTADGPGRELTVRVRPDLWFERPGGSIMNPSTLEGEDGDLPELEVEMEEGFTEVEIDDEDD